MNENPFQSPTSGSGVASATADRETLRKVATYQRGVLYCILLQLLSFPVNYALRESAPVVVFAVSLALLAIVLIGTVLLFLLAKTLYSIGVAVLLAILTVIPCVGLIVLLIVNSQATKVLRQNGIRVGFMGADTSQL